MSYPKTVLVVTNGNYFTFESHPYRHDNYNYIVRQFCSKPYLIVMLNSVRLAHVAQLSPCCFIFYKRRILFWTSIFKYGIKAFGNYLPTCLTDSFYWPQTTLKLLIGCALYYFQVWAALPCVGFAIPSTEKRPLFISSTSSWFFSSLTGAGSMFSGRKMRKGLWLLIECPCPSSSLLLLVLTLEPEATWALSSYLMLLIEFLPIQNVDSTTSEGCIRRSNAITGMSPM